MSERINVDHAFDPEARKAQADFDAYMDQRVFYKDDNDKIHNSNDGQKFATEEDANTYEDAQRDNHYQESLEQGDYSNESLDELARRVAAARAEGDKTRANDAEEAFFNKFAEYSEKYGWENEDGSADGPHVDKNAKLGRSTIDDRLDRYSKIMYGDESPVAEVSPDVTPEVTVSAENSQTEAPDETPAVESQDDSYVPKRRGEYKDETDTPIYNELMAKHRAETPAESVEDEQSAGMDVDAEVEAAKAKLAEEAARKEAEAIAEINGTDQAKADRELLEGAKKESASSRLKVLDEAPAAKKAIELKVLDEGSEEKEAEAPRSTKKRVKDAFTPAGAAAELSAWTATREKGGRRNRLIAVLGGGALAVGLGWFMMRGHDVSGIKDVVDSNNNPTDPTNPNVTSVPTGNGGGRDLVETVRVRPGDGEIKVTQSILENNGVHVNTTEAQQIGEHANIHDILKGDSSYAHSGSTLDRIGKTGEFEARKGVVSKLLKAARQLGHK